MKIILIISVIVNLWFASTIIRLEKFHYSVQVGMCENFENEIDRAKWIECNDNKETRTNRIAHLYYGLTH
jgi:hypothetical protein